MSWIRRSTIEGRRAAHNLVGDCEAFLDGQIAERLRGSGSEVPAWAWTNLLAHGAPGKLAEAACARRSAGAPGDPWSEARSYLAAEILNRVAVGTTLEELQQQVFLPLELAQLSNPAQRPVQWVTAARRALNDFDRRARTHRHLSPGSSRLSPSPSRSSLGPG